MNIFQSNRTKSEIFYHPIIELFLKIPNHILFFFLFEFLYYLYLDFYNNFLINLLPHNILIHHLYFFVTILIDI